jgi:hypothetical protein
MKRIGVEERPREAIRGLNISFDRADLLVRRG